MEFWKIIFCAGVLAIAGSLSGAPAPASQTNAHSAAAAKEPAEVLPFIPDDFQRALANAKAANRPIFVEAWAPW